MKSPIYLDCNATSPVEPEVRDLIFRFLAEEFGNEGSRTHEYGARAKQAVQIARDQVAAVTSCQREEVVFTSGATEANNIAILGLTEFGEKQGRMHILSTQIEHKAVLEPLAEMQKRGFEIELLEPNAEGWISAEQVQERLRSNTLMVSLIHANNETGVIQPIEEVAAVLKKHEAYLHVDAAQTFGKELEALRNPRVDLISASAHKIFGPKGVGALITRRRGFDRVPLKPLTFGGGQERGLRPGTLPVPLIAGFGLACKLALKDHVKRNECISRFREKILSSLESLSPMFNGDQSRVLPHVLNLSLDGLNSEAVIVGLKDLIAISNGSACTSASYNLSHVLKAMRLPEDRILSALRISWCHMTPDVDWATVCKRLESLRC